MGANHGFAFLTIRLFENFDRICSTLVENLSKEEKAQRKVALLPKLGNPDQISTFSLFIADIYRSILLIYQARYAHG